MKGNNRIKSMLLALLLSLSMVVTYFPASMIAYAETEDSVVTEQSVDTEVNTDDTQSVDINEPSEEELIDVVPEDLEEEKAVEETGTDVLDSEEEVKDVETDVLDSEEEVEDVETESLDNEDAAKKEPLMDSSEMDFNASVDNEPVREAKANSNGITALAFTSDVHNGTASGGETNVAAIRLEKWLSKVQPLYGNSIGLMGFCGDMAAASSNSSTFWTFTKTVMDLIDDKDMESVYAVGNHEYMNGEFSSTSNSPEIRGRYKLNEEGYAVDGENYVMYCLGTNSSHGTSWAYDDSQITDLTTYLNGVSNDKVIIILTHFPLHDYGSHRTGNTQPLVNAINNAALGADGTYGTADDKKIVYLWGHNHSEGDNNYDQVWVPNDNLPNANNSTAYFYYAAAGSMADAEYGQSAKVLGKGLVLTINEKKQLSFAYYDANGNNVTEPDGEAITEEDPVYPTSITVSPKTLEVEVGRTSKPISVSYEPDSTNQKGVTWTSSDPSVATVKDGKVKGVSTGTATITATSADGACSDTSTVTVIPRSTEQTYYIIKIGNYVLSTERSGDEYSSGGSSWYSSGSTYTGLAAVDYSAATSNDETISWIIEETDGGYYIMSLDGKYLNATYTSGGGSGWGGGSSTSDLKLDDTPDVWVLDDGVDLDSWVDGSYLKSSNTDRYLCEETGKGGSHLFSVRSKDNADETSIEDADSLGEEVPATAIAVSPKTATVEAGSTKSLKVTFTPDNTTNKKVTWSSSNTSIATVSSSGVVTGVAKGTATITATYTDNTALTDTCEVTVTKPAGSGVTPDSGKKYVILASDGYALTSEGDEVGYQNGSGDQIFHYYGLTGEEYTVGEDVAPDRLLWTFTASEDGTGYYIQDQNGKYLNGTYGANDEGGSTGRLKLDDTPDIWIISGAASGDSVDANILKSTNASATASSDKYLTHGNGDNGGDNTNIFTLRSEDNATSTTFYEYDDNGTYVSDPDDPTPIDPPTPTEGNTYKLVNSFTAGKDYLIVSANSAGSGYALTNPGGTSDGATMGRTSVTIQSGDVDGDGTSDVYISNDATDIVWTAATNGSGFNLSNNGDTLEGKSGNVKIFNPQQYSDRYWTYSDSQLQHHGGQNTYTVYYSGSNFTSSYNSTSDKIYIYEKTEPVQGDDPVESVALNKTETTLAEGDTEKLVAEVSPSTAADKSVTWSSSDETIATVSEDGTVTAVKEGTATITVTTNDGGMTATCTVTVTAAPEETTVDITPSTSNPEKSETIKVGAILTINVTNGSQNSGYDYTATLSNSGIARIEGNSTISIDAGATKPFTVKGIAAGTVDITIKNSQSSNQYARTSVVHLTVVDDDTPIEPPTPGDGDTYKLVDQFTDGNEYLIVSANSAGSGYALTNPGGTSDGATMGSTAVTIESGDIDGDGAADLYITSDATNIVWTAATNGSGFNLSNNGDTLEGKSGEVKIYDSVQYADRYWTYSENQLQHSGGQNTYTVYCSGSNFTSTYNSTSEKIYIYEKTEPVAGDDPVESVALNKTETTLTEGDTEKLVATVSPATAADKSVTWSSSDETIATVSEDGTVTAVKEGIATITVTTNDGGMTATCTVTVTAAPEVTKYVLTDTLVAGKEYLIVNDAEVGSTNSRALKNPGGTSDGITISSSNGKTTVMVLDGNIIETNDTDIVWTASDNSDGVYLTNDGDYLEVYQRSLRVFDAAKQPARYWTYEDNHLTHNGGGSPYYLVYSNGSFTSNTSAADMFLFVKVEEGECVHDWGEWVVTAEPTCTVKGVETSTCSKCGETKTREVDALDHDLEAYAAVAATCTADGNSAFWSCKRCGKFFSDAACTEEIAAESWIIPATGHTPGEPVHENEIAATCTTAGRYEEAVYCTVCGIELNRRPVTTDPLDHDWGDWVVTTPATELMEGVETKTCSRCGETETQPIPKLPHTHHMTSVAASDPTCTTDGNTAYWICNLGENPCRKYFSDAAGTEEIEIADTVIPATGHTPGDEVIENNVDPTCTATGRYDKVVYCTVCEEEISRETVTVPARGHAWSEWTESKPATELEEGEQTRTCLVCGETDTRVIPKLDHVHHTTKVEATAATCTEAGNIEHWVCSGGENPCGRLFEDEDATKELNSEDVIIPATGHDWGAPTWTWANDNSSATATFTCKNDESHVEEVEAVVTSTTTEATCEADGKTVYTATAELEGRPYTYVKEVTIPATGHDWNAPTWTWADDNSTATATFICKNDPAHVKTVEARVTSATTNATCEKPGKTVYTALATFDKEDYTDTKETSIPATGHDYELEKWFWNGYTEAKVRFTCKNDRAHFEDVDAEITTETIDATCDAEGKTTYTAIATFEGVKYPYIQTVTIPKKDHNWGEATYAWADDLSTVTATRICKDFAYHVETETVSTTSKVTKPAACEAKGETTYTAEFENNAFRTQTKTVTNIDALGHDLAKTEAKEATCEEAGNTEYWTCATCGKFYSDAAGTTEITKGSWSIPPTGHKWNAPTYEWSADNSKVTATRICQKDSAHVETETVAAAYEVTKPAAGANSGEGVWSAKFKNEAFEDQIKKVEIPPAPGSDSSQSGAGGPAGPGASAASAENVIKNMAADTDLPGAAFGKLMLKSPSQTKTSIKISWSGVSGASKYVIYGNKCGKSNKPVKLVEVRGTSKTFRGLAKGTYYKYVAVALDSNNTVVSTSKLIHVATKGGKVGNHKSVKIQQSVINKAKKLKVGKSLKLNAKAVPQSKKLKVKEHVAVRYESSNPSIAKVSSKGKVKGVRAGTCYVYAYAQNGVFKKIKITVK